MKEKSSKWKNLRKVESWRNNYDKRSNVKKRNFLLLYQSLQLRYTLNLVNYFSSSSAPWKQMYRNFAAIFDVPSKFSLKNYKLSWKFEYAIPWHQCKQATNVEPENQPLYWKSFCSSHYTLRFDRTELNHVRKLVMLLHFIYQALFYFTHSPL